MSVQLRKAAKHWTLWLLAIGAGCGGSASERTGRQPGGGAARVGGDVVSTVDGAAITVSEVQRLVNQSGLSPRQALSRLQDEALLMHEAEARGYGSAPEVLHLSRQAAAQALLAGVVESLHASDQETSDAYAAQSARFDVPEKRRSVHVLARLPAQPSAEQEEAAHAFADEVARAFAEESDPEQVRQRFGARTSTYFEVRAERLPPVANDKSFVPEFMQAIFSVSKPGPVREPVRSVFGWHAIYVTEIEPAIRMDLAAARPALVREIESGKRKHALDELLRRLRSDNPVVYDVKGQKALASLEF